MPKIECDRDCYNCPYPDVPEECLAKPIQPWESKIMQEAHNESARALKRDYRNEKRRARSRKRYAEKRYAKEQAGIGKVRRACGMMQKELAAAAGVTPVTMCQWEKGITQANWDKLCAALPELEQYRPKGGTNGDRI